MGELDGVGNLLNLADTPRRVRNPVARLMCRDQSPSGLWIVLVELVQLWLKTFFAQKPCNLRAKSLGLAGRRV